MAQAGETEVRLMRVEDIDGAIETIWKAFADDPYSKWIFDQKAFNPSRNRQSLTLRCHWGISHGLFYVASHKPTGQIIGTAMWLPPHPAKPVTWGDYWASWYEYLGLWGLWLGQVRMNATFGRGGLIVKRYWLWKEAQAEAQGALWTDPRGYYFLNIVTILPEWQGKGVGRKMMEAVLQRADAEGMPCYLESSRREPNVALYERFGFELRREMVCDDDGTAVMLYCMIREPKGKTKDADSGKTAS